MGRKLFTGNTLILSRGTEPAREVLREARLTAATDEGEPPESQNVWPLSNGQWVAKVRGNAEDVGARAAAAFGVKSIARTPLTASSERYLYLWPPTVAPRVADDAATEMTWGLERIGIDPQLSPTGRGAVVAVLDSGIDLTHPDFRGRVCECDVRSFVDNDPTDELGHGTHCAGIIAGPAVSHSGRRYAVAPNARLVIGKIYEKGMNRAPESALIAGLYWARDRGASVVSISVGAPPPRHCQEQPDMLNLVIKHLLEHENMVVIAAAGNGRDPASNLNGAIEHPASCPSIIAVGAIDERSQMARFSATGTCGQRMPTLFAPGVDVFSAVAVSRQPASPYARLSGTSQAAPHVAGVAAQFVELGFRGAELREQLVATATLPPLGAASPDERIRVVTAPH